jgi:REP element-mobilizing transposase RayT
MARPLRIEFPGAVYHVTARGDRRESIFADDTDRQVLLTIVEQGLERCDAQLLAFCLMHNHYHFVLQTQRANLSRLMRHINGVYSQRFNRRHGLVGHVLQGRFHAVLIDRDAYLLEACRYVDLNPVRAALVEDPGAWPWSSFRAHAGLAAPPRWLDSRTLHAHLLRRDVRTPADSRKAARMYAQWVAAGHGVRLWDSGALRLQIYLGDDAFVERMLVHVDLAAPARRSSRAIPMRQRAETKGLADWMRECGSREEALWLAHTRSGLSMTALAAELGLSVSRVSQLIAKAQASSDGRQD